MKRFVVLGLFFGLVGGAYADASSQIRENVALFDELVSCSKEPTFASYGLSQGGPCAGWVQKVKLAQKDDKDIMISGYSCIAGNIRVAGNSLRSGDMEHFNWVKQGVEECRASLK